jgi:hypothetical protein
MKPLKAVYDFNPMKPLDLLHVTLREHTNMGASKRAKQLRKIKLLTRRL